MNSTLDKADQQLMTANRLFNTMLKFSRGTYYVREINKHKDEYDSLMQRFHWSEQKLHLSEKKAREAQECPKLEAQDSI